MHKRKKERKKDQRLFVYFVKHYNYCTKERKKERKTNDYLSTLLNTIIIAQKKEKKKDQRLFVYFVKHYNYCTKEKKKERKTNF